MVLQNATDDEEQTLKYLEFKGTLTIKLGETLIQVRKQCRSLEDFYKYTREEMDFERKFVDRAVHAAVIAHLIDKYLAKEEFKEGAFPLVLTEHQARSIPHFLVNQKKALDPTIESLEQAIVDVEDDDGKEAILRIWKEAVRLSNGPPSPQTVERAMQKIISKFYPRIHRKNKEYQAARQRLEEEEQEQILAELKKKKAEYYQYLRDAGKKVPDELEEEEETSKKRPREESHEETPTPKRKRGRPPKNPNHTPSSSSKPSQTKSSSPKSSREPIKVVHGTVLTRKQQHLQGVVTRTTARELGLEAYDLIPKTIRRTRSLVTTPWSTPTKPKRPVGRPRTHPLPKTKPMIEESERRTPTSEPPKRKRGRPPKKKSLRATEETEIVKELPYQRTPDSHSRHSSTRSTEEEEDNYLEPSQYRMELEDPRIASPKNTKSRTQKDDFKAMASHISQLQKKLKEMERTNRSLQHQIQDSEEQLSSMRHLMERITTSNPPMSE